MGTEYSNPPRKIQMPKTEISKELTWSLSILTNICNDDCENVSLEKNTLAVSSTKPAGRRAIRK